MEAKASCGSLGKLSVAWSFGVSLWVKGRSNEIIASDAKGAWTVSYTHLTLPTMVQV